MCGIVGYIGQREAVSFLLPALRRLEYRGYDSSGVATVDRARLDVRKAVGKIATLEALMAGSGYPGGTVGIAHTRWATHGRPSDANAHPHVDCGAGLAVVHNGIIDNYRELRQSLVAEGHHFRSQTDTEVIAHLIEHYRTDGLPEAVRLASQRLHGAYALVCIAENTPDLLVAVRDAEAAEKGGHPHFMLKEITEQPRAVRDTIGDRVDPDSGEILIPELGLKDRDLAGLNRLCFVACGTSWHAALVGKYLVEEFARLPVEVDIASEFRYRRPVLDGRVLTVPISQSGETADTLAALRAAKDQGSRVVAICNVVGSSMAREADGVLYTRAGLEIGVASTKAFTAQLTAVTLLALRLGRARRLADPALLQQVTKALWEVPDLIGGLVERSDEIRRVAARFAESKSLLYLGRGLHFPLALEGALKLKEISYIHAEGYAAGEMKHGPIALIDQQMPVVVIAPVGPTHEKMCANIEEVKARDGIVVALAEEGDREIEAKADVVIPVPAASYWIQPLLVSPPLQLFAYHLGVLRGCDVDQPRNLAKSVTVE